MAMSTDVRQCTVYEHRGSCHSSTIESCEPQPTRYKRTVADHVPLREVMRRELICARPDLELGKIAALMVDYHVGCVPIVDERRRPLGVITKFDLVEHLATASRARGDGTPLPIDLVPCMADDVMMPIALALDERATVAHAAAMMTSEDTHHVLVVRAGELVGVVSAKDIVTWLAVNDGLTPPRDDAVAMPPAWRPLEG
jgi:CBS domain-containing protein